MIILKQKHKDLFKELVKAYYNDNFEEKVKELIDKEEVSKEKLSKEIAILCGVHVDFNESYEKYIEELKDAIKNYESKHKIVTKIGDHCGCIESGKEPQCQKSCPFDAILLNKESGSTYIDSEACVDCGICVEACENGNILDKVQFMPLLELLKSGDIVIAEVAPAITNQFNDASLDQMRTALKKIGFSDMIEVAFFADMLTLKEAAEFNANVKSEDDFMITSCCCPMWVGMLKKVYSDLVKYVSPSVSPMVAGGRVIKKLNPNAKVVFIGPCVAKKAEAKEKDLIGDIDYVLTFTELEEIFNALNIEPSKLEPTPTLQYASKGGRLYARTGGVSKAITECIEGVYPDKIGKVKVVKGDGVKDCKELLNKALKGEITGNFIEGMGCKGGCVGGPKALLDVETGTEKVNKCADESEFINGSESEKMNSILAMLGINELNDLLNEDKTNIFHRNFK